MAHVPIETPQISTNVPSLQTPQIREFGKVGEAAENIGNTVEGEGFTLIDKVKQAEAQDASSKAYYSDKLASDDKIRTLKLNNPDGYMTDPTTGQYQTNPDGTRRSVTQEYHDWSQERYQSQQESMPSQVAAQAYKARAIGMFSDETALLHGDVQKMKVSSFEQAQSQITDANGNALVISPTNGTYATREADGSVRNRPDMNKLYGMVQDQLVDNQANVGVLYDQTEADARKQKLMKNYTDKVMQGAYTSVLAQKKDGDDSRVKDIQSWRDILAGNDPQSKARIAAGLPTLSSMMDPERHSIEEEKLIRLMPVATQKDLADWNHAYANAVSAESQGKGNPAQLQQMSGDILGFVKSGDMSRGEAIDKFTNLVASHQIGKIQGPSFALATPEQQAQMLGNSMAKAKVTAQTLATQLGFQYTADEGAVSAHLIEERYKSEINKVQQAKRDDFPAFMAGGAPNGQAIDGDVHAMDKLVKWNNPVSLGNPQSAYMVQQGVRAIKAGARASGMDMTSVPLISKDQSAQLARPLTDPAVNASQASAGLQGMQKAFGADYPTVIQNMIKNDHLSPDWTIAQYNPTIAGSTHLVAAIRGAGPIMNSFDERVKQLNGTIDKNGLQVAVGKYTAPFIADRLASDPYSKNTQNFGEYINKAVSANAAQLFMQRNGSTPGELEDAAKNSFNELLGNFVHQGDPNGHFYSAGLESPPIIPKSVANDSEHAQIMSNLKGYLTPDKLKTFGLVEPPQANGKPGLFGDKYAETVVAGQNHPHWSYIDSANGPGFILRYRRGLDGIDTIAQSGSASNPKPLFVPLDVAKTAPMGSPGLLDRIGSGIKNAIQKFNPDMMGGAK